MQDLTMFLKLYPNEICALQTEVMTGFGKPEKFQRSYETMPDIICLGKSFTAEFLQ
jgi:adenosylmethionine-8-amino-7-oxononanoate aminotransferase